MKEKEAKEILLSILAVAILILVVLGISFAAFNYSKTGETVNTITTGSIVMNYSEPQNGINIVNAQPIDDSQGMVLNGENNTFDFMVSATMTGETTINYAITATKDQGSTIADEKIKVYLTSADDAVVETPATTVDQLQSSTNASDAGAPDGQYVLKQGTYTSTTTTNYRLRMWIKKTEALEPESVSGTYKLRVNVYGKTITP